MAELNSNQFPAVYRALGVEISKLGFVGLELDPLPVTKYVPNGSDDLHYSSHPDRFWIRGPVAETSAHMTVIFGLMQKAYDWAPFVDEVLAGWQPKTVEINHVDFFPSNLPDEDYACIIGHVKVTDELAEGNARLRLLPHIDTFPLGFKPHVTLAYVRADAKDKWIEALQNRFAGLELPVKGLNYGKRH